VNNGDWNPLLFVKEHIPLRISAAQKERDELILKIQALNLEIAVLQTLLQVPMQDEPSTQLIREDSDGERSES
jgi:hypothetical protein